MVILFQFIPKQKDEEENTHNVCNYHPKHNIIYPNMLETPHVALGAVIAKAIPNPLISVPLSFASHFILDMTPHWNPHLNTEIKKYGKLTNRTIYTIIIDLVLSVGLTSFLAYKALPNQNFALNILLCSFSSILPDVVEGPYFLFGYRNKFLDIWMKFQKSIQVDANVFWGILTQIILLSASLFYFFS